MQRKYLFSESSPSKYEFRLGCWYGYSLALALVFVFVLVYHVPLAYSRVQFGAVRWLFNLMHDAPHSVPTGECLSHLGRIPQAVHSWPPSAAINWKHTEIPTCLPTNPATWQLCVCTNSTQYTCLFCIMIVARFDRVLFICCENRRGWGCGVGEPRCDYQITSLFILWCVAPCTQNVA